MANFDWRNALSKDLLERYDEVGQVIGRPEWDRLVTTLREYRRAADTNDGVRRILAEFDAFLRALDDNRHQESAPCRVFVSHQQADVQLAERIAYLATEEGFEYWLDVHDPLLTLANQSNLPPLVRSVLIAAIVEIALLNCSHAIAVQTQDAQKSRWVPYEYGRAKRRLVASTQVASWFEKGVYASTKADYLKLGVCALSETAVVDWLRAERSRAACRPTNVAWNGEPPEPLPN